MKAFPTKQCVYFPAEILREMKAEAARLDRPLSWVVQQAWRVARGEVRRFPAAVDPDAQERDLLATPPPEAQR
jgi:uncharacterized small protein (TIGR04563 family)